MQRAWCICGIIIIIVMSLKLYVRRYDPPLALLRVINISMNPSSGPTSTNANKFNNDGYWKWKHMMWWDVNPVVRTWYFDVFVHANNYLHFDLYYALLDVHPHHIQVLASYYLDRFLEANPRDVSITIFYLDLLINFIQDFNKAVTETPMMLLRRQEKQ